MKFLVNIPQKKEVKDVLDDLNKNIENIIKRHQAMREGTWKANSIVNIVKAK